MPNLINHPAKPEATSVSAKVKVFISAWKVDFRYLLVPFGPSKASINSLLSMCWFVWELIKIKKLNRLWDLCWGCRAQMTENCITIWIQLSNRCTWWAALGYGPHATDLRVFFLLETTALKTRTSIKRQKVLLLKAVVLKFSMHSMHFMLTFRSLLIFQISFKRNKLQYQIMQPLLLLDCCTCSQQCKLLLTGVYLCFYPTHKTHKFLPDRICSNSLNVFVYLFMFT